MSLYNPELDTREADAQPSFLESAYGLTAGTIIAGSKDIVDSLGAIGSTIGITSSYEPSDTRDVILDYAGEQAAQFYDRNPHLVEGAGLLVGTLVPGGVGIKALRVAQAAKGSMLGKMLRLPESGLQGARDAAKEAMLTGDAVYSAIGGNYAKALVAGAGANVLDMAAFEIAAMSVTFASPVYSDFTKGDFAEGLAYNILFGGAVGTLFSGAKTSYQIATATRAADKATAPLRVMPGVAAAKQEPWVAMKGWLQEADIEALTIEAKQLGATDKAIEIAIANRNVAVKEGVLTEAMRLTNNDRDAATKLADMLLNPTAGGEVVDSLSIVGLAGRAERGVVSDPAAIARTFDTATGKSFDAGMTPTTHLGDSLSSGHKLTTKGDSLVAITTENELKVFKIGKDFEALDEVTAQAAWVRSTLNESIELAVAGNDLPALEKLLGASDSLLAKSPANAGGKLLRTHKEVEDFLFTEKVRQAELLSTKLVPEQIMTRLNVTAKFLESSGFDNMIARSGDDLSNFLRTPRHVSIHYNLPKLTAVADSMFLKTTLKPGAIHASVPASEFLRSGGKMAKPLQQASLIKKFEAGKKVNVPTVTVRKDGTVTFDGNKRVSAASSIIDKTKHEGADHIPVHVIVEKGATIPTHLPSGAPFPVVERAGQIVANPKAQEIPIRLTRAFQEERMRIDNLNLLHSEERSRVATSLHTAMADFPEEPVVLALAERTTRADKGAGFTTNTEGVTGGVGAMTQHIGALVSKLRKAVHEVTDSKLNPVLIKPMQDTEFKAGAELIQVSNYMRSTESNYVIFGGQLLREDIAITKVLAGERMAIEVEMDALAKAGNLTPADAKLFRTRLEGTKRVPPALNNPGKEVIPLSEEAYKIVAAGTERNSHRLAIGSEVHAVSGTPSVTAAQQHGLERVYFPPVNTKKYNHFVFVRQADGITATSHTSVVTAASPEALATKVKALQREFPGMEFVGGKNTNYDFFYKRDVESYHKAKGDYDYARGMNDNAIDSTLRSKKMMHEEAPPIDKQHVAEFFNDFIDWHRRMDDKSVRDVVELKYAQLFKQLEVMGSSYAKTGTSVFGGSTATSASFASQTVANPFGDMIKQALDIGKQLEYPTWVAANEFLNKGWAKASLSIRKAGLSMLETVKPRDFEAEAYRLNAISEKLGFGNPYEAVMISKYREMLPANPSLTANIAKGNAMLNFLVLGSDMLQAFNTLIGTTVHATELVALRKQITSGAETGAGKLAGLAKEEIPGSVEVLYRSTQEYFTGGQVWNVAKGAWEHQSGKQMMDTYIRNGLRVGDAKQLADAIGHMEYNPNLTATQFGDKIEKGMEAIRTLSGNTPADAISRFMAARSMHIYTDIAMSKGLISSEREAAAYITQHVTRVHGATVASQRPIMFSGPIGQSIGLFMTFYTNFLQRMFQHAGAGDTAALGTMAGMQVGLYGLQGLPAFNWINTHMIGTASGNTGHRDIYGAIGGSEEAKWMMFGAGSNMLGLVHPDLKVNLYSRGDLNPRSATIMPVLPTDTALYTATAKTMSNIKKLAEHISGGAGIKDSLLFALEHNGISRPISGLGAFLGGGQTTNKAGLLSSYANPDFQGFAMLARLAGGKPLDDATAADALYRQQAYKADKSARISQVGESMRIAMKNGQTPDVTGFLEDYVHAGGDTANFNRFMKRQFATANNSQINKAAFDMDSPEAEGLARVMGGEYLTDIKHPAQ